MAKQEKGQLALEEVQGLGTAPKLHTILELSKNVQQDTYFKGLEHFLSSKVKCALCGTHFQSPDKLSQIELHNDHHLTEAATGHYRFWARVRIFVGRHLTLVYDRVPQMWFQVQNAICPKSFKITLRELPIKMQTFIIIVHNDSTQEVAQLMDKKL